MLNQPLRRIIKFLLIAILILFPFFFRSCISITENSTANQKASHSEYLYLIQSAGNHLIMTTMDGSSSQILDIDPRTLPPYDQNALIKGIYIKSETELEEILQDFN